MRPDWPPDVPDFGDPGSPRIPRVLDGGAVWVLGGGPSLPVSLGGELARRGRRVVAANNSYRLTPVGSLVVGLDLRWLKQHRAELAARGDVVVTALRPGCHVDRLEYVDLERDRDEVWEERDDALFGRNSGHAAVALAAKLGASRIYCAGLDMQFVAGRTHWHDGHPIPSSLANYTRRFRPALEALGRLLEQRGVLVRMVTPSAAELTHARLEDALEDDS